MDDPFLMDNQRWHYNISLTVSGSLMHEDFGKVVLKFNE
jgi:hypothetical protein